MKQREGSARGWVLILAIVVVLCLLGLWALVILAATGQFRNLYAQVGTPQQPLWIQVKANRIRHAATPEELANSPWTRATTAAWATVEFPPIDLPLAAFDPGLPLDAAKLRLASFDGDWEAEWQYRKTDQAGVRWDYLVSTGLEAAKSPESAVLNEAPPLGKPTLEVDAEPTGEAGHPAIGVALLLSSEHGDSVDVRRDGRSAEIELRILDREGKVVASERGPLEDFGYT
jgi:hypothetical protein